MTLFVERTYRDNCTLSDIRLMDGKLKVFDCKGLELPWRNNERKVSCIPEGAYKLVRRNSPRFGDHFHVLDVPNRTFILIHHGNYTSDIEGCLLVGSRHQDINGDGIMDVTASRFTMAKLLNAASNPIMAIFFEKGTDPAKHIF
jgi:hypothetical protein